MKDGNRVTGQYTAIVTGKKTGLSGCMHGECPRHKQCIRADPLLAYRVIAYQPDRAICATFIPK